MSGNQPANTPAPDWREQRRLARAQRRNERHVGATGSTWIVGGIFVLLGVLLLAQNFGAPELHNWWALIILIPAVASLGAAWRVFNNNGAVFTGAVVGPLCAGLVLVAVTAAFLFELNWALVGPILLIVVGVCALIGAFAFKR